MVKQICSLYVGLVFLTLLTYDTTSKQRLITRMYVKDSKIFVATQVWRGRPLQPYTDLTQVISCTRQWDCPELLAIPYTRQIV